MQPTYRIVADGADITSAIKDRLLDLQLTDKPGLQSDTFQLSLDDRDGAITLPPRGAALDVHMGYAGQPLSHMGRYVVDSIVYSGAPNTLLIKGKAADMLGTGKTQRSGSWENTTLAAVVRDISARNGWTALCPVEIALARVDQVCESDYHLITRLARQHDCTAKLNNTCLMVLQRHAGSSASGRELPVKLLNRGVISGFRFTVDDRQVQAAVSVFYQDADGVLQTVRVTNAKKKDAVVAEFTDRHPQPNHKAALQTAQARLAAFNRQTAGVHLDMPGCADLFAELPVQLKGFKSGIDGEYLIDQVSQHFTRTGWTTSIECNAGSAEAQKTEAKKT
ncbi:MAG: hypothetical protein GAK44_00160 [Pseudomonas delhiensis]|nr:MAG: hypothetical protein GAK44_00160 [Pseudomonas delhiensis]